MAIKWREVQTCASQRHRRRQGKDKILRLVCETLSCPDSTPPECKDYSCPLIQLYKSKVPEQKVGRREEDVAEPLQSIL